MVMIISQQGCAHPALYSDATFLLMSHVHHAQFHNYEQRNLYSFVYTVV